MDLRAYRGSNRLRNISISNLFGVNLIREKRPFSLNVNLYSGRVCGSSPAHGSAAAGVSAAVPAASPAGSVGSASPAGMASLLRPNRSCCRFASWACSSASRCWVACKTASLAFCAPSSCSQRAHAGRSPTRWPFSLNSVLPTTAGPPTPTMASLPSQAKVKCSAAVFLRARPDADRLLCFSGSPELLASASRSLQKSGSTAAAPLS